MLVFENEFVKIDYYSDQNYILVYRQGNIEITDTEYYHIIDSWLDVIKKYKPEKQLVDYSDLTNPVKPEYYSYARKILVIPAVKISIKKTALLVS